MRCLLATMISGMEHGHVKCRRRRRRRPRPVTAGSHILEYESQLFHIAPAALHIGVVRYASSAQLILTTGYACAACQRTRKRGGACNSAVVIAKGDLGGGGDGARNTGRRFLGVIVMLPFRNCSTICGLVNACAVTAQWVRSTRTLASSMLLFLEPVLTP